MQSYLSIGILLLVLTPMNMRSATDPNDLLARADHLAEVGNTVLATPLYVEAEQQFHQRGDISKEMYAKLGRLHREVESGSYQAVADELERDLHNAVVEGDPALKIRALDVKGTIDLNLNTAAAQDDFSEMQALAKSIGDRKWENRAAGALGIIAGVNGDVGTAAAALVKAIHTARALHDIAAEVKFSTWLANGMTVHGMADRAIPLLDQALILVSQDPEAGFPVQLYIAKVRALIALRENSGVKRQADARHILDDALKYARENDILGAQAELLNQAGLLAMAAHELSTAEHLFSQTVEVAERAHLPRMEAEGFLHLSEVHEQRKEIRKAVSAIDSGIEQVRQVQERFDLPVYLARKAELEADLGNLQRADLLYQQASDLIEAMLINAPTSHVKSSMIAALSDIYVGHFRLAVSRLHDDAKAFRIIETARGRVLGDSIRYARRSTASNSTSAIERRIAVMQRRLREVPLSPAGTKLLLAKLDQAYNQLAPVEYERSRAEMKMATRPPVAISVLQHALIPGEVLIEYVLDEKAGSHAVEITGTAIRVHDIPPKAEVSDLCQRFLRAIKAKSGWSEAGKTLFERVVQPAIPPSSTSVVIVPDGPLNLIPFASLQRRNGEYFAQTSVITLAPSATIFQMLRMAKQSAAPKSFLGVAYSPVASSAKPNVQHSALRGMESGLLNLQPLPFAREEVQAGARVAGNDSVLLVDDAATESALKSQGLSDFRVIHVAAHGFSDVNDPDRAGLVLAPGEPKEDGLWQAREIRESRISADLVTLSACETGVGRLQGEEGIMNLARTFLIAGTKSVVASLWDADDRSTATLMTHFYQQIGTGRAVAEALREAQLRMLKEFGADMQPFFWAGFTVIGDGNRKISFTKTKSTVEQPTSFGVRQDR